MDFSNLITMRTKLKYLQFLTKCNCGLQFKCNKICNIYIYYENYLLSIEFYWLTEQLNF